MKSSLKFFFVSIVFLGLLNYGNASFSYKKKEKEPEVPEIKNEQQFENCNAELKAKANVFVKNAESLKTLLEGLQEKDIEDNKDKMVTILDSMLDNNLQLQEITKKSADKQKRAEDKNFYMRSILPNLHNINRQISRIKVSVKGKIRPQNIIDQASRTQESMQQVVDRLDSYANQ